MWAPVGAVLHLQEAVWALVEAVLRLQEVVWALVEVAPQLVTELGHLAGAVRLLGLLHQRAHHRVTTLAKAAVVEKTQTTIYARPSTRLLC